MKIRHINLFKRNQWIKWKIELVYNQTKSSIFWLFYLKIYVSICSKIKNKIPERMGSELLQKYFKSITIILFLLASA